MTRLAVDASVAVEYLLRTPLGLTVANTLDSASLIAPELMDAEVLSVLRRAVLNGVLEEARAEMAVEDLAHWPVDRISHRSLAALAWLYHRNVSARDAFYVAVAREHGIPLMTADGRLSRAPGLGVVGAARAHRMIRLWVETETNTPAPEGGLVPARFDLVAPRADALMESLRAT